MAVRTIITEDVPSFIAFKGTKVMWKKNRRKKNIFMNHVGEVKYTVESTYVVEIAVLAACSKLLVLIASAARWPNSWVFYTTVLYLVMPLPLDPLKRKWWSKVAEVLFNLSAVIGAQEGRLHESEVLLTRCLEAQKTIHGPGERTDGSRA